ncbi:MAG: sn-glycerol-1-phosphate dehydrogenase [Clostridia bacterium]|nr:sn-glycerol-1-phosphate dehydrogenase [Clostridia bacterium]
MQDRYTSAALISRGEFRCGCGKTHRAHLQAAVVERGAVRRLSEFTKKLGGTNAYMIADKNTYAAAGRQAEETLRANGVRVTTYIYPENRTEPDEKAVGAAFLHRPADCDILVAVGSGVMNDIMKIVALATKLPFIVVGTAPSMDGYASSTSSVIRDKLKVSVDSACPNVILGDIDILEKAPKHMLLAGLGDMLAKYISVCEWRIGNVVTGEYYCEEVAAIIRAALKKCVDNADGLLTGSEEAVRAVMDGLIVSGIAADYAGVSRPVSGVEHYFSHIWDMRALEFGTPFDLHGVQCGVGTLYALKGYEKLRTLTPDALCANAAFAAFDAETWQEELRRYLGSAAQGMIENMKNSVRYDAGKHAARLHNLVSRWPEILRIIDEELPAYEAVLSLLRRIGAPTAPADFGLDNADAPKVFAMTRDIRDKYILSTLAFDLGILDTIAAQMTPPAQQ